METHFDTWFNLRDIKRNFFYRKFRCEHNYIKAQINPNLWVKQVKNPKWNVCTKCGDHHLIKK